MLYFEDLQPGLLKTTGSYAVREDEIIDFARQWDPQPFHIDPVFAATTPMQGLFASSAHTYAIAALLFHRLEQPIAGIASIRHEIELPEPVRPGDVLHLQVHLLEKRASASKPDRGLVKVELALLNQDGQTVMRNLSLMMVRRRPR
jgi:acyl dehydratase